MAEPRIKTDRHGKIIEIYGKKIVINDIVVKGDLKRGWLERLFTWPFRPFKRYKTVTSKVVADGQFYYSHGTVVMNSATYKQIQYEIKTGGLVNVL